MKKLIMALALLVSASSYASELDCKVVKVYNDNIFEEGLSTHEYPDVFVEQNDDSMHLSIGAMQTYSTDDGDFIKSDISGSKIKIIAQYSDQPSIVFIEINKRAAGKKTRRGKLSYKANSGSKIETIASIVCY